MREGITTVLVTGSRDWKNWALIRSALEPFFGLNVTLVHGDARGADKMSAYVWENWGGTTKAVPANWERFGKSAGFRRNEGMVMSLDPSSSVVVAFTKDNSNGTQHCMEFAKSKGLRVIEIPHTEPITTEETVDTSVAEPVF